MRGKVLLLAMSEENKRRCSWVNLANPQYVAYHDREWGVPCHDDGKLFEALLLEVFQAGLSFECVLNKREAFREAFDGFDPEKIANYDAPKLDELMTNKGIIRNRKKIEASVTNASVFLRIKEEFGSFSSYLWSWTKGKAIKGIGMTSSPLSDEMSSDLRKRGMKFIGATTVYAYLQAVGVIDSHVSDCFLAK